MSTHTTQSIVCQSQAIFAFALGCTALLTSAPAFAQNNVQVAGPGVTGETIDMGIVKERDISGLRFHSSAITFPQGTTIVTLKNARESNPANPFPFEIKLPGIPIGASFPATSADITRKFEFKVKSNTPPGIYERSVTVLIGAQPIRAFNLKVKVECNPGIINAARCLVKAL